MERERGINRSKQVSTYFKKTTPEREGMTERKGKRKGKESNEKKNRQTDMDNMAMNGLKGVLCVVPG